MNNRYVLQILMKTFYHYHYQTENEYIEKIQLFKKTLFQILSNNGSHWLTYDVSRGLSSYNGYYTFNLYGIAFNLFDHLEEKQEKWRKMISLNESWTLPEYWHWQKWK